LKTKRGGGIGVIFENKGNYRNAESILYEVASEIESIATKVGLAQPVILERCRAATAGACASGAARAREFTDCNLLRRFIKPECQYQICRPHSALVLDGR
jgi:hypothetical protein